MPKTSPKIDYLVETARSMVRTIHSQGGDALVFSALLYKNGKKLNSIELADAAHLSKLVRQYIKSEGPDKVRIELKTQADGVQKWMKVFDLSDPVADVLRPLPAPLSGYGGLGEAEVNDLVNKRFEELEKQRELERSNQELAELRKRNAELQRELEQLSDTLEAKNQVQHWAQILGMAMPGLARVLQGTALGPFTGMLAGQADGEAGELPAPEPLEGNGLTEAICGFVRTLSEQETATLYLLMAEIEKDRTLVQQVLHYLTQPRN